MSFLKMIATTIEVLDRLGNLLEGEGSSHPDITDLPHHVSHQDVQFGEYQFSDEHIPRSDNDVKVANDGNVYKSPSDYYSGVNGYSTDPNTPLEKFAHQVGSETATPTTQPNTEAAKK